MRWLASLALLVTALLVVGCTESDATKIREANTAARAPTVAAASATAPPGSAVAISVFDVRVGDCFKEKVQTATTIDVGTVTLVRCDSPGDVNAVIDSFTVDYVDGGTPPRYPGEDYFTEQLLEHCDANTTVYLFPLQESWAQGDRVVICAVEVSALDSHDIGLCFDFRPFSVTLTDEYRVPCSTPHQVETFFAATYPSATTYPGDAAIGRFAERQCLLAFEAYVGIPYGESTLFVEFVGPSRATWRLLGHRTVSCYVFAVDTFDDSYAFTTGSLRESRR